MFDRYSIMFNPFFKNVGPHSIEKLLSKIDIKNKENFKRDKIYDVTDLSSASKKDLTFFHSKNYASLASKTKASYCVTTVIIRNTIVKDNVSILDGCVIGKKGFGFFPNQKRNIRYPHIGIVIINDNCEIGCGSTIDRGSLSNTVIGKNTYLDNQVHIAHNNKIGDNCIIAGQVGFAGSSSLGNNVMIGGQAGISGHLKIGNNVHIGGGSGVINDISDNTKVMGYPAKNLRQFIKNNR